MTYSLPKNHVAQAQCFPKLLNEFVSLNICEKQWTCSVKILTMCISSANYWLVLKLSILLLVLPSVSQASKNMRLTVI